MPLASIREPQFDRLPEKVMKVCRIGTICGLDARGNEKEGEEKSEISGQNSIRLLVQRTRSLMTN
jgi:hypothetical protein